MAAVGSEGELGGDVTPRFSSYGPSRAGSPAPESAKAMAAAAGYGACFGLASGGHTEAGARGGVGLAGHGVVREAGVGPAG